MHSVDFHFNPQKAAQATGYLLKENGGEMDKYLLIKMLYLADRKALEKWCEPITRDRPVSMKYGPALSTVYDLTKGAAAEFRPQWEPYISNAEEETNRVYLKSDPGTEELSPAELSLLSEIHQKFKSYSFGAIRDFSHELAEYEEVGSTSRPIPFERILKALGKSDDEIRFAASVEEEARLAELIFNP